MSPLAEAAYGILRLRPALPEPRITYAELARVLRGAAEGLATISHRSRELYAALDEIGEECRRLELPPLPALVVRADSKRPGAAYHAGPSFATATTGERVAAWREDLEAVKGAVYPPRRPPSSRPGRAPSRTGKKALRHVAGDLPGCEK